jgi:TPR repeat protein
MPRPDMKANRLIFTLLLASSMAVVQLAAQQTNADQKPIEEVKAKAEAGDAESQVELGRRYDKGEGVAKNQVEAVKWYRKAAEQNFAWAQYNLGGCYLRGQGVADDLVEAYKWLLLATRQGDEDAKKVMTWLEKNLRPEQVAQGQKRAREFKPR